MSGTKWVLYDPTSGADTFLHFWTFPINPNRVDSIIMPRNFTVEHTSAVNGQYLLFEGGRQAKPWTFSGELLEQADMDTLTSFSARPYRMYVGDDHGRLLIVKVLGVQTQPIRDMGRPDHQSYVASCLLYGRAN